MLCAAASVSDFPANITTNVYEEQIDRLAWAPVGYFVGGVLPMTKIEVGETCYYLRDAIYGEFCNADYCNCEFWAGGFSPTFVGLGENANDAFVDWRDGVHQAFQNIYRKRPFEMSDEDIRHWKVLDGAIDVIRYRNQTPILIRQIGCVKDARNKYRRVTWINKKTEPVALENWPGEFASYKPGQYFEAEVERNPISWKLQKVCSVRLISGIRGMPKKELLSFWNSLPTTNSLPESKRDWTES